MATVKTPAELRALLDSLGRTAGEVVATLTDAGITGLRDDPQCCPVANWLVAQVPGAIADVDHRSVTLTWPPNGRPASSVQAENPVSVQTFISRFDGYEYPELDRVPLSFDDEDDEVI